MPTGLYRDAHLGIRARLRELEARIRDREAEVTDAFWDNLDADIRAHLARLKESLGKAEETSLDELARAEGALSQYASELDALILRLPAVEEEWREVPDGVADPPDIRVRSWAFRFDPDGARQAQRLFENAVRERDRDAEIVTPRRGAMLARFRDRGAPFALRGQVISDNNGNIIDVALHLVTSTSRATPALSLRHETMLHAFGKVLGVKREVDVGDDSFDGLFFIEATKPAVERLLPPQVRAQLLALARYDIPTLVVDPRAQTASLRWRFEPSAKALDAAVRVLASIREAGGVVRFLASSVRASG
jgi:hypothetical protein